jgi:hypothetical protein
MSDDLLTSLSHRTRAYHVFEALQKTLSDILGVSRNEVTPTRRLDSLLPRERMPEAWEGLRTAGFALPPLKRKLLRPRTVELPGGCETLQEAVFYLTPFSQADYRAGLWPRAAIAGKVRCITARALGMSLDSVPENMRFQELYGEV